MGFVGPYATFGGVWGVSRPNNTPLLFFQTTMMPEEYELPEDQADDYPDNGYEDNLTDVEADAMTLRDAGYGTDEDYGYFGETEYE